MISTMKNNKKRESLKGNSDRIPFVNKALSIFLALISWQVLALVINEKIIIVGPLEVLQRIFSIWKEEDFLQTILFSLLRIFSGFSLAVLIGTLLAILANKHPFFETLIWPWMSTIKSVPVASFIVICLIWMSAKNISIFISFLIVLPIIYQNMSQGIKYLDQDMDEFARVFRLSSVKKLKYVVLPQMKPYIISAVSVAIGLAWKSGIAAEVIGSVDGSIGRQLYLSKVYLITEDLLAWTFIIVILSVLSEKLIVFVLKRLLK